MSLKCELAFINGKDIVLKNIDLWHAAKIGNI